MNKAGFIALVIALFLVQNVAAQTVSSVLKSGRWVKVAVSADGVYKIPYAKLSEWGFSSPQSVRVFGNDFGMLPFMNSDPRPSDLIENKVMYATDALYFYAKSKDIWSYNQEDDMFEVKRHLYDSQAYYFLSDVNTGYNNKITKQMGNVSTIAAATVGDFYAIHENDDVNLQMSGRNWYGEKFYYAVSQDFKLEIPVEATGGKAKAKVSVVARSSKSNTFSVSVNGGSSVDLECKSVSNTAHYADVQTRMFDFVSNRQTVQNVSITFNKSTPSAEGYLDYILLNARGNLTYKHKQLIFRDLQSYKNGGGCMFKISGADNNSVIWNITDSNSPVEIGYTIEGGNAVFSASTEKLEEYVIFSLSDAYIPEFVENVENQNLHSQSTKQMVIITPYIYKAWAEKIANIHSKEMSVGVVVLEQIYNEFSCGARDVSAIRDYLRYVYRNPSGDKLRYVLLFGDGSVDNITLSAGNTNVIPTYQSPQSLDEDDFFSFVSDDYFALMDDDEGEYTGLPDIAVGRIPVKTAAEAETAVKKISLYTSSFFNDWEKNIAFIADDENQNIHVTQADKIAEFSEDNFPDYNIYKIFLDAYPRQQTIGGNLYPQAREDILTQFSHGAKIINFTGHGGINYLTDERILTNADIDNMNNIDNLPVFITSSCDVGRFDYYTRLTDNNQDSPAERALHNANGGAIAMITAARHAYSEPNFQLNSNIFNHILLSHNDGGTMRLGDVVMLAKQQTNDINMRCFLLLGDPALALHSPDYEVKILKINGIDVANYNDTVKALQKCRLECAVTNTDGSVVNNFNGNAHVVYFDKPSLRKTLNNSGNGAFDYKDYISKLFDGFASVNNGKFTVEFVVPKDIDYNVDYGKVSFFARSDSKSASGCYKNILTGPSDTKAQSDYQGPEIELFLNSKDFVDGGNTDPSPLVIAFLRDPSGINVTSEEGGHDISLSIDGEAPVSLNSFYKTDSDSYSCGSLEYRIIDLEEGTHTIKLKAWDSYNNSSYAELSFTVQKADGLKITRLLNYPNPFNDYTNFLFHHNAPTDVLDYEITVFSLAGRHVKTLSGTLSYSGNVSEPIEWDGKDDFGSKIASGVYVYRLWIRDSQGRKATAYEKLLYLK